MHGYVKIKALITLSSSFYRRSYTRLIYFIHKTCTSNLKHVCFSLDEKSLRDLGFLDVLWHILQQ